MAEAPDQYVWFGWHFSDETECLRYGDGRKIRIGITHRVDCKPVLCKSGLHASASVLDALEYAPSQILWRVSLSGDIVHGDDKSCATERTYHARLDATEILHTFARRCALDIIHLWNAPQVVRDYLATGDEKIRDAARAAARGAASSAAWDAADAAMAAAWDAARAAARGAASSAAWDAADAARAAAWDAAWDAARAAARGAAWGAADAAMAAAWAAAWGAADAARVAAWDSQKVLLEAMVNDALASAGGE